MDINVLKYKHAKLRLIGFLDLWVLNILQGQAYCEVIELLYVSSMRWILNPYYRCSLINNFIIYFNIIN